MSSFAKAEAGGDIILGLEAIKRVGQDDDLSDVIVFLVTDAALLDQRRYESRRRRFEALMDGHPFPRRLR